MASKKSEATVDVTAEIVKEPDVVSTALDGCVIDWTNQVQVNPKTGQKFDFEGNLLP